MKQKQYAPMSVAELALSIYAVNSGYFDSAVGNSNDRAPLDAPISPPGFLGAVAGSSGSIFIPTVALLALLALAAPAICRRLREAPGLRAPTPFVCALERPG